MRKLFYVLLITILAMTTLATPALADKPTGFDNNGKALGLIGDAGFDQYGYNYTARVFSGRFGGWCAKKGLGWNCELSSLYAPYANDHLVMKWNAEWDRGNAEGWSDPNGYAAWENNEWNGMNGGSGEVWHYKITYYKDCEVNQPPAGSNGYCLWGPFLTIMDQGTANGVHTWFAHVTPSGYGAYK